MLRKAAGLDEIQRENPVRQRRLAVRLDRAGARDELGAGQVSGGEFVDDGQAEHQTRRRPAHVGKVEIDRERSPRRVRDRDAHKAVLAVGVAAQRDLGNPRGRILAAEVDRDRLPGFGALQQGRELLHGGDRLTVDRLHGVTGLQLAHRRPWIGDRYDGDRLRVLQIPQRRELGVVLGLLEIGVVGLVDVLPRRARGVDQVTRHQLFLPG